MYKYSLIRPTYLHLVTCGSGREMRCCVYAEKIHSNKPPLNRGTAAYPFCISLIDMCDSDPVCI